VRLKVSFVCCSNCRLAISIPFGAIKSIHNLRLFLRSYIISIPFGAIKSQGEAGSIHFYGISIPFGAIKRRVPIVLKRELIHISIPFGAIKSSEVSNTSTGFQISIPFGAIKSPNSEYVFFCFSISIPFGAIKSSFCKFHLPKDSIFQFLLVRLKVKGDGC